MDAALAREGEIYVTPTANYACVLFYSAQDPDEYRDTVVYTNYPSAFLSVGWFGRFRFSSGPANPDPSCVYLMDRYTDRAPLEAAGFDIEWYGYYWVAYAD